MHESGFLTLWTLIESKTVPASDFKSNRIDHQSTWSTIKLNQSKCIDLRMSIETFIRKKYQKRPRSGFKKTQSYFESDLFNDSVLQELQDNNQMEEKILTKFCCTAMEISTDSIFVATNENFLLYGKKSMRENAFQKIQIDDNGRLQRHASSLLSMKSTDGVDIILAGLSDGTIKSFRIASKTIPANDIISEDEESSVSLSSSLPSPHNQIAAESSTSMLIAVSDVQSNDASGTNLLGKSCAIQNIVTGERNKPYDDNAIDRALTVNYFDESDMRLSLFGGAVINERNLNKYNLNVKRLLDDQTVVSGIALQNSMNNNIRKILHLIYHEQLFILQGNRACLYNLNDHTEVIIENNNGDIRDIAIVANDNNSKHFVVSL